MEYVVVNEDMLANQEPAENLKRCIPENDFTVIRTMLQSTVEMLHLHLNKENELKPALFNVIEIYLSFINEHTYKLSYFKSSAVMVISPSPRR